MKQSYLSIVAIIVLHIFNIALAQCVVQKPDINNPDPDLTYVKSAGLRFTDNKKAGERIVITVNGVDFAFRWCPPGTFMMGSPESEENRENDETQHQVTLTQGFWMMENEVNQKQWKAVMEMNPSRTTGNYLPVESVTWNEIQEFLAKCVSLGFSVKLPTEAQWEYACRAESTKEFESVNSWGLRNMHDSVWEACSDWYGSYSNKSISDPTGPSSGRAHVYRGGNNLFFMQPGPDRSRSASRHAFSNSFRWCAQGFRCIIDAKDMNDILSVTKSDNMAVSVNETGRLYVLSIWGTNANKELKTLQKLFDKRMTLSGLNLNSKNDPDDFVADYKMLIGEEATKKNILDACYSINMRATKNDVIFVYICCRGLMKKLNKNDNRTYHFLFPEIKNVEQLDNIDDYGISRSAIINALTKNEHRLVVLITDADTTGEKSFIHCDENEQEGETLNSEAVDNDESFYYFSPTLTDCRLRVFLRTNVGIVDYNSTSPYEGFGRSGGVNAFFSNSQGMPNSDFFSAFMSCFILTNKTHISKSEFINDLKLNLSENNYDCSRVHINSDDIIGPRLFDFKGLGYIIDNSDVINE